MIAVIDDVATILRNNGLGSGYADAFCDSAECGNTFVSMIYNSLSSALCNIAECGNVYVGFVKNSDIYPKVFRRNIPAVTEDMIIITEGGGGVSDLTLNPTDRNLVTIVSQSRSMERSMKNMQLVRNIILKDTPYVNHEGNRMYDARILTEGKYDRKLNNVPIYVHAITFHVKRQSKAYDPIAEDVNGVTYTDIIASYIEQITGERCFRGQMPPVTSGLVYSVAQTGGGHADVRLNGELMDAPEFTIRIRSSDIIASETAAIELHNTIHQARHIGKIVSVDASPPAYVRSEYHEQNIKIKTIMERI